jgi:hypothetical protein
VPKSPKSELPFSQDLKTWVESKSPKTIESLAEVFGEKSFAVIFLVLMALPATPLPTGGITHVFEIIVALLAAEMVIGLRSVWLPEKWKKKALTPAIVNRGIPYLITKIAWIEKYSRPRLSGIGQSRLILPLIGILIIVFTTGAFFAPPFSGLDTLPALGVVLISLGLILEDVVGLIAGIIVGTLGIFISVGLGKALINLIA